MKILTAISALVLSGMLYFAQPTQAWSTSQNAAAFCKDNNAAISWSFSNTEPNDPKWAMDVVVTDNQTGVKSNKVTVQPGETATGTLIPGPQNIVAGSVTYDLTWTDGRSGIDSRTANYDATDCVTPVDPPEFSAMVKCSLENDLAKYTLKITQSNNTVATFVPADSTVLASGDPITVTATYTDEYQETQTVSVTASGTDNCEQPIEVCRDDKVISILPSERLDTDTDAPCPEVQGDVTELPNTGIAGLTAGFFSTGALGLSARSWLESRRLVKAGLLKR